MRVQITQCNNESRWYMTHIGRQVDVAKMPDGNYFSADGVISSEDCIVIDPTESTTPPAQNIINKSVSHNPNALSWKGTPGPWKVKKEVYMGRYSFTIVNDKGFIVAKIDNVIMRNDTLEANAHMISAAPEAVEFIADLLAYLNGNEFVEMNFKPDMYAKAEEILKKAYNH